MNSERLPAPTLDIIEEDWQNTPAGVKRFIVGLVQRVAQLEERVRVLEEENRVLRERLERHSQNSSQPPSSDGPTAPPRPAKARSAKRRGGQPGHVGHARVLHPVEQCQRVVDHYPTRCRRCGGEPSGVDERPYRHQVVELPPIIPSVEEHRLHERTCAGCGTATRATLPPEVPLSGYGPRVVATVALLSSEYRMSERMVEGLMQDLLNVSVGVGTVAHQRQEASAAVAVPVPEAHAYVQQQKVVHADETGFRQGNADGLSNLGLPFA